MSTQTEKYRTNIVQIIVFLGVLFAGYWMFQNLVIKTGFRNAMVGLFAPSEVRSKAKGFEVVEKDFLLDMSDKAKTMEANQYDKASGDWIVRAEKLGEEPITIVPWLTFGIFSMFVGFIVAVLVTSFLPKSIGYISNKIEREIDHTVDRIDEQTGDKVSREEIERITSADSTEDLLPMAKEFGNTIVNEIEDIRGANAWKRSRLPVFKGLRLYMKRHFAEKYANQVQGFAYGGAAILIVIIGIRGLKFIPGTQPSILLAAITLEFSLLSLLAITLFYTEEEERLDKLIRDLEESSEGQKYELINLVRTSQQQQRDLASMVDYIQRQTDSLQKMSEALTGANREYIIQVAQRAVAEYITKETSQEITEKVIREKIDSALSQMFGGNKQVGA
ncbi:MAG: hypothetical protein IPP65_10185 [Chlorobi bacterium]|nr:hypothetical protein [Chlorobiota bacterium]